MIFIKFFHKIIDAIRNFKNSFVYLKHKKLEMKNYLLIVFGNFSDYEFCKNLSLSLTPVVDSPFLKFQHTNGAMIFHFASSEPHNNVVDFVSGALMDFSKSFVLTEINDSVSIVLPKKTKEHLLNLDQDAEDIDMKFNWKDFELDEDYLADVISDLKSRLPKPSLDELLEKISTKGIESLSPFEKDILDDYSKN